MQKTQVAQVARERAFIKPLIFQGPVAQKLKIKRKSQKSNASQKNQTQVKKIKRNFAFDFFSVAQKVMFDIKHKYQTQVSKIKRNFMPWLKSNVN